MEHITVQWPYKTLAEVRRPPKLRHDPVAVYRKIDYHVVKRKSYDAGQYIDGSKSQNWCP